MSAPGTPKLAVVVEDEWVIRMQIADTLEGAGCQVREFADGEPAINYLNASASVDVLVTDIRLPGPLTGWDIAHAYRERYPDIRVIYCSGNSPDEPRRVTGSVFLPKPCNMEKLLAASRGS